MNARTLLIILDDVGPPAGISPVHTPYLHMLRNRCQVFDLWTMPNCSGTRAAIFTRRFPCHTGIGTIVKHNAKQGVEPSLFNLPPKTGLYGKYHMAPQNGVEEHWRAAGFEHFEGHASNLGAGGQSYTDWNYTTPKGTVRSTAYAPEVIREAVSMALIQCRHDTTVYAPALIHEPLHIPPDQPPHLNPVHAMLARLDSDVEHVVSIAIQCGYRIAIMSDNGAAAHLGGGKGTLYQSGIRTDLITHGFGIEPHPLCAVDILTLLDGVTAGDAMPIRERRVRYAERFAPNGKPSSDTWSWAVESKPWKLIRNGPENVPSEHPEWELYNLAEDPHELTNVIEGNTHEAQRLLALAEGIQE